MPHSTTFADRHWWHTATVYQIYPASFKDSNGDGFGDINGIISKVDYIASLGVDAVWLSPCYKSPYVDMGYDISDYREIDPRFGSVADVELLISKLRERNVKLIMDLVVNHTSDQHAWFQDSRSHVQSRKRDWYIWRKGRTVVGHDGVATTKPPNNWESQFKGSAWEYDPNTDEYYLRLFAKEQPDLNWENAEVRRAIYEDMRFWLDKGIGGFRMDVINMISKPSGLPDAPVKIPYSEFQPATKLYCNGPRIHEYIQEMRREVLDHYPDIMTVGEVPYTNEAAQIRKYVDPVRHELGMLFQFDIFSIDMGPGGKFTPSGWERKDFKSTIAKWQQSLSFSSGSWQTVFLESHDAARSVSRFGDGTTTNRFAVAKVLAMLETTLGGTLFMHQGQEIGMVNLTSDIPIEHYKDIETQGFLRDLQRLRQAASPDRTVHMSDVVAEVADEVRLKARDHGRMPMPWDHSAPHAGFSESAPWTCMNTDTEICSVAGQDRSSASVLNFWRRMLSLRKRHSEALVFGDFEPVTLDNGPIFAYHRKPIGIGGPTADSLLVVLNLTNLDGVRFDLPSGHDGEHLGYSMLASSKSKDSEWRVDGKYTSGNALQLGPYEGMIVAY